MTDPVTDGFSPIYHGPVKIGPMKVTDRTRTPLEAWQRALHEGFAPDKAQERAVAALETLHQVLHLDLGSSAGRSRSEQRPRGLYLWGPVGRGKTWLMDIFHASLRVPSRRQHFHHFMRWVHRRLFQLTGSPDPLDIIAAELADEVRVLCFDELFISDIGDAMLLGRLFVGLFEQGIVLVATSNQAPQQLYEGGHNRERLLPAIAAIERHMQIIEVDGGLDHRLHPSEAVQRYWVQDQQALPELFNRLNEGNAAAVSPIELNGRRLQPVRHGTVVVWFEFAELCERSLAALDYIALCDRYDAILLENVPRLGGVQQETRIARGTEDAVEQVKAGDRVLPALSRHDDSVRRFIALVDECYDRRVPLYIEAEVPLDELYTEGALTFPFRRALSRLQEMQTVRFQG